MQIFFTNETYKAGTVTATKDGYSLYDVMEQVLFTGFDEHNVSKAAVADNRLTVTLSAADAAKYGYFTLVDISGIDGLNGQYRVLEISGTKIKMKPDYGVTLADKAEAAVSGKIKLVSGGWERPHKSQNDMVLRPKGHHQCFLIRKGLPTTGIQDDLTTEWNPVIQQKDRNAPWFTRDLIMQPIMLRRWEDGKSVVENYNNNRFTPLVSHNTIFISDSTTKDTVVSSSVVIPQRYNNAQSSSWTLIASDKFVYLGISSNQRQIGNFQYSTCALYGMGITQTIDGKDIAFLAGLPFGAHVNTNYIDRQRWQQDYYSAMYTMNMFTAATYWAGLGGIGATTLTQFEYLDGINFINNTSTNLDMAVGVSNLIVVNTYHLRWAGGINYIEPLCSELIPKVSQFSAVTAWRGMRYAQFPVAYTGFMPIRMDNAFEWMKFEVIDGKDYLAAVLASKYNNSTSEQVCKVYFQL